MEAKIRAVPYLVAKLWSSDIRPIRTGMRLMYPPLVNPKMMEYAIVAAADEVGNHNANAKMAVLAVHIIMTLNLSQSTAKQENKRSNSISQNPRHDPSKATPNIKQRNHIIRQIRIDPYRNGIARNKRQRPKQSPIREKDPRPEQQEPGILERG
jgi:hypothetical protein